MKKWASVMLIGAMSVSVLAGCQGNSSSSATSKPSNTGDSQSSSSSSTSSTSTASGTGQTYADQHLASWPTLHLKMTEYMQTGNFTPKQDVLTPIWREKTKIIPENVTTPGTTDITQAIQQWLAAGNLPDVFATLGVGQGTDAYKLLKTNHKLREIKLDDVKKYMPRFTAWLQEEGGTIEQWYQDNVDPQDGKLWEIPITGGVYLPGYQGTRAYNETSFGMAPYYSYVRDDILKKIFPDAKSEAELNALYKQQGGKLNYDQITDIPIDSMADLENFMKKVQALNLNANGKPLYAQLQSASQSLHSTLWSMFSVAGYLWSNTGERVAKGPNLTYTPITPEWKDYYKWWNGIYNSKLVDPETFIQKNDQMNSKAIDGQYYLINQWNPVADARAYAKKNNLNYGYRIIPYFRNMPLVNKYADMRPRPESLDGNFGAAVITTQVSDANFAQVMNWFDWNMSKEAAELRTWGLPEWSAGTGKDRRFKPEYQAVADWEVNGIPSDGKDGNAYGLYDMSTNASVGPARWNPETYGIQGLLYKDAPRYVYPPKLDGDLNLDSYIINQLDLHIRDQSIFYHQTGFTWAQLDPGNKFQDIDNKQGVYAPINDPFEIKMMSGKPEDFDKNWQSYLNNYNEQWKTQFANQQKIWADIWNKNILPELQKNPKWKPVDGE